MDSTVSADVYKAWQVADHDGWNPPSRFPARWDAPMTARLLTNIGRLWTGSEILSNAAIVTSDDRIAWVGPSAELPRSVPGVVDDIVDVDLVENLGGGLVTPGLIDAHTHPVYAGNRYAELAMRSSGLSDSEITAAGGGISSTVTVTRGTDPWTLATTSVSGWPSGCSPARRRSRRRPATTSPGTASWPTCGCSARSRKSRACPGCT